MVQDIDIVREFLYNNVVFLYDMEWLILDSQKQTILTEEGLKNHENELEELKSVKRKEIAEKIKVALSFGDLSENSEYDEAKKEQAIMEARIL